MRKLWFPKKYNPHLGNITHNVPTNLSLREVRFLLMSHEISILPNHYDLIPNLGTYFTGSNKLRTKIPAQVLPFVSAIEESMRPEFYHIQQEKDIPLSVWSHAPFLHPKHRFLCRDGHRVHKTKFHKDNPQRPPPSLQGIFPSRSLTLIIFVENIFNM